MSRFHRELFLNDPESVGRIRALHIKDPKIKFLSLMLVGEEALPVALHLYASQKPAYNEYPVASFVRSAETNELELQPAKKKR